MIEEMIAVIDCNAFWSRCGDFLPQKPLKSEDRTMPRPNVCTNLDVNTLNSVSVS